MIYSCPNCDRFFLSRSDFDRHTAGGGVSLTVDDQPGGEGFPLVECLTDERLVLRGFVPLDRTATFWIQPRPASL